MFKAMNVKTRNIKISVAGREGMLHRVALNHQYHTNECHKNNVQPEHNKDGKLCLILDTFVQEGLS